MGQHLGISRDCREHQPSTLCPCLSSTTACLEFSCLPVLSSVSACVYTCLPFWHEMYSCFPSSFAIPVTKFFQHSSHTAFYWCKYECTDSHLGDLSLHEAQQQQHIAPTKPFPCLPALKASQKHTEAGQESSGHNVPWLYIHWQTLQQPIASWCISPTAIIIFAEAGSILKN